MILPLSPKTEAELQRLAEQQGRDVRTLAEEAIRQYLDAANITDLSPDQVGDLQMRLAPELPPPGAPPRNGKRGRDAAR